MFIGKIVVWKDGTEKPELDREQAIELTEWGTKTIELRIELPKEQIYLRVRLSDLFREIEESQTE